MVIADYARLARAREKRQSAQRFDASDGSHELSGIAPRSPLEKALRQQHELSVIPLLSEREKRHLRKSVRG